MFKEDVERLVRVAAPAKVTKIGLEVVNDMLRVELHFTGLESKHHLLSVVEFLMKSGLSVSGFGYPSEGKGYATFYAHI